MPFITGVKVPYLFSTLKRAVVHQRVSALFPTGRLTRNAKSICGFANDGTRVDGSPLDSVCLALFGILAKSLRTGADKREGEGGNLEINRDHLKHSTESFATSS